MSHAIPFDVQQAGPAAVAIYEAAIAKGTSPRMAEMFAMRQAPRGSTDSTFFAGVGSLRKQLPRPFERKRLAENARKMGVTLTGNEFYNPSLARFPMDPQACISQAEGKAKVKQIVEKLGVGCEGAMTIKGRDPEGPPQRKFKLHPRIIRRELRKELANPANAKVDRRQLVEKIIDKHGPRN